MELKAEQWLDYAGEPMPCYPKSEADQYINKYKRIRCLDMARWCNEKWSNISTPYYKSVFYYEWRNRWLALADKFK